METAEQSVKQNATQAAPYQFFSAAEEDYTLSPSLACLSHRGAFSKELRSDLAALMPDRAAKVVGHGRSI